MQSNVVATTAQLQHTVKRQAKRLQKRLDIQLHQAKKILAQAAYQCPNWDDLENRLRDRAFDSAALLLSRLPESSEASQYLQEHIQEIARSIGRLVLANHDLLGMIDVLWFVFEEREESAVLSDAVGALQALPWYTTSTATDPMAVISAYVNINGVPMKLLGTRVYLPQYMNLGDELNPVSHLATNPGTPFEIMWSDPEAWHAAATAYLSDSGDDSDETNLKFPRTRLTVSMRRHEEWFRHALSAWSDVTEYREYDEAEFIPLVAPSGCYLIFGFPTCDNNAAEAPAQGEPFRLCSEDDDFERTLVLMHGHPLCIHWTNDRRDSGLNSGSSAAMNHPVLSHPDCDLSVLSLTDVDPGIFFIHPASNWDIRFQMQLRVTPNRGQVATVIRTDNVQLTEKVLEKVANRQLTRHTSDCGFDRYMMVLNISDQRRPHGFSLAFDILGECQEHWSSLVSTAMSHTDENGNHQIILELNDRIFILFEKVGKQAVLEAARDGIVLHGTQSLDDAIDQVPRWCNQLPVTPPSLITALNERFDSIEQISPFDLWRHVRLPKYHRDNF